MAGDTKRQVDTRLAARIGENGIARIEHLQRMREAWGAAENRSICGTRAATVLYAARAAAGWRAFFDEVCGDYKQSPRPIRNYESP